MFSLDRSRKGLIVAALLFLCVVAGGALENRETPAHAEVAGPLKVADPASLSTAQTDQGPRYLVRVFMHGEDLYPDVVHARPGRILLRAENETGLDVALIFERVLPGRANEALARVNTIGRAKRADRELVVGVGEYVFYDETFPALKGKLIVEPR